MQRVGGGTALQKADSAGRDLEMESQDCEVGITAAIGERAPFASPRLTGVVCATQHVDAIESG